jgi:hypothetical protein
MPEIELIEVAPGKWRVKRPELRPQRSDTLALPYVISDEMPPTEQIDGKFYTSKSQFRRVGRSAGLTEVGNERPPPKKRATELASVKRERRQAIQTAVERYKAGQRPRTKGP